MDKSKLARIEYIIAMIIYGTCGIISKYIDVSSGFIVFSRAIIGSIIIITITIMLEILVILFLENILGM